MRLLRTGTVDLELRTFISESEIPPYAILSHTWIDSNSEVVYADLSNSHVAGVKAGRKKVEFAKSQARLDGLEYVWIDTCCIDKSSSAELTEAINSMFRWYQKSTICYVYMDDVPDLEDAQLSESLLSLFTNYDIFEAGNMRWDLNRLEAHRDAFRQSNWFNRGWTLQEMLAPTKIRFYSRSWTTPLGTLDKLKKETNSFVMLIESISRVHARALSGRDNLISYSVAQRMSWAATRVTTRQEDQAYSLLGLFEINMPIIYGEGMKAFERLQLEILRSTPDQTIMAWKRPEKSPRTLLAPHPMFFKDCWNVLRTMLMERCDHDITTQGVRLTLPLLRPPKGALSCDWLGVIACHYEGSYTQAMMLRLYATSFQQYIVESVDAIDLHEVAHGDALQIILNYRPETVPEPQWDMLLKKTKTERVVCRVTGVEATRNALQISGGLLMHMWREDLQAFEFDTSSTFRGQIFLRCRGRQKGIPVRPNDRTDAIDHGHACASILVSVKRQMKQGPYSFQLQVAEPDVELQHWSPDSHRRGGFGDHEMIMTRRRVTAAGLLVSAKASRVVANHDVGYLILVKAMRLTPPQSDSSRIHLENS